MTKKQKSLSLVGLMLCGLSSASSCGPETVFHNDGFGHSWNDDLLVSHDETAAHAACKTYRISFVQEFIWQSSNTPTAPEIEQAADSLCQSNTSNGKVTSVCTVLTLDQGMNFPSYHRIVCWMTADSAAPGTISINNTPVQSVNWW